jgi:hypothetical protein
VAGVTCHCHHCFAASGFEALFNNSTGPANAATGFEALFSNTIGGTNTANGYRALASNTTGLGNTAIGNGEEVADVNPGLVVLDKNGEVLGVRYEDVNAMLLNEFLKEHRRVQKQEATITQLKKDFRATVAQLATRLDEQAAQIQKVSKQVEASKATPPVVNNP